MTTTTFATGMKKTTLLCNALSIMLGASALAGSVALQTIQDENGREVSVLTKDGKYYATYEGRSIRQNGSTFSFIQSTCHDAHSAAECYAISLCRTEQGHDCRVITSANKPYQEQDGSWTCDSSVYVADFSHLTDETHPVSKYSASAGDCN